MQISIILIIKLLVNNKYSKFKAEKIPLSNKLTEIQNV